MVTKEEICKYLKQINKRIPLTLRGKLAKDLQNSIDDYREDHPNSTMADIINHFGTPENFANAYLLAMDDTESVRAISYAKQVKRWVLITLVAILLIIMGTSVAIKLENSQQCNYYYRDNLITSDK